MSLSKKTDSALQRLLKLSSPALVLGPAISPVDRRSAQAQLLAEWLKVLERRNGFYSFESALHVFPSRSHGGHIGLDDWNSSGLWRGAYGDLDPGVLFFAEDVFGNQFGLVEGGVCRFDAETAEVERFADTPEDWTRRIVDDFNVSTGFPIAHRWQELNGPLASGLRLLPKVPFVLRGEYAVENLYAGRAVEGMRVRGHLATQLVDLPEGAQIEYKLVE
jgi:hypothetical protein